MGHEIDVKVSSVAYLVGVPVLFVGVVAVSATATSVGAAILTVGWLAMAKYGLKMAKAKKEKKG